MTASFVEALVSQDLEAIRRCPKADLHNHCGGSGDRAFLRERTGIDVAPLTHKLRSMDEMHAWVQANVAPVYAADASGTLAAETAVALAAKDGVTRLEIGYDVWMVTQGRSAEDWTRLMAEVFAAAPGIEWIAQLSMSRHCSINALTRWLAPFLQLDTYRTLDLSGDELAQPIENFRPLYRMAKHKELRLKARAPFSLTVSTLGESGKHELARILHSTLWRSFPLFRAENLTPIWQRAPTAAASTLADARTAAS